MSAEVNRGDFVKLDKLMSIADLPEYDLDFDEHDYTCKQYSKDAFSTVMYPEAGTGSLVAVNYCALAAGGEMGEIQNKLKKVWRGDKPLDAELRASLADEAGDVLWYLDRLAVELGYDGLEAIAKMNIAKLRDRRARNMTKGDGDKR